MLSQLPPRYQVGLMSVAALTVVALGFIGGNSAKRPPEIKVTQQSVPLAASPTTPSPLEVVPPENPPSAPPSEVVVHVAGAVKSPQVVRLKPGARVEDAIKAAGGAKPDADLDTSINLAAKVQDGDKILVHSKKEVNLPVVETSTALVDSSVDTTPKETSKPSADEPSGPVSLNTGSQSQLESLPGVGPATAKKIIQYRHEHGGFSSIDEVLAVKGIGAKKLAAMRKWLKL